MGVHYANYAIEPGDFPTVGLTPETSTASIVFVDGDTSVLCLSVTDTDGGAGVAADRLAGLLEAAAADLRDKLVPPPYDGDT